MGERFRRVGAYLLPLSADPQLLCREESRENTVRKMDMLQSASLPMSSCFYMQISVINSSGKINSNITIITWSIHKALRMLSYAKTTCGLHRVMPNPKPQTPASYCSPQRLKWQMLQYRSSSSYHFNNKATVFGILREIMHTIYPGQ